MYVNNNQNNKNINNLKNLSNDLVFTLLSFLVL